MLGVPTLMILLLFLAGALFFRMMRGGLSSGSTSYMLRFLAVLLLPSIMYGLMELDEVMSRSSLGLLQFALWQAYVILLSFNLWSLSSGPGARVQSGPLLMLLGANFVTMCFGDWFLDTLSRSPEDALLNVTKYYLGDVVMVLLMARMAGHGPLVSLGSTTVRVLTLVILGTVMSAGGLDDLEMYLELLGDESWAISSLSQWIAVNGFLAYTLLFPGGIGSASGAFIGLGSFGVQSRRKRVAATPMISGGIPSRSAMLRHARFVQFEPQKFSSDMCPHDLHWRLEEGLEDQGVTGLAGAGPRVVGQWSPVVSGESGDRANVADYLAIEGGFRGKRGEAVPPWVKVGLIFSVGVILMGGLFAPDTPIALVGSLSFFVFALSAAYWRTYLQGEISVLYRGSYQQGPDGPGSLGDLSVEIMFSVDVKKPFIGEAVGMGVIAPAFDYIIDHLHRDLREPRPIRVLPELVSRNPNHFESRFPVSRV